MPNSGQTHFYFSSLANCKLFCYLPETLMISPHSPTGTFNQSLPHTTWTVSEWTILWKTKKKPWFLIENQCSSRPWIWFISNILQNPTLSGRLKPDCAICRTLFFLGKTYPRVNVQIPWSSHDKLYGIPHPGPWKVCQNTADRQHPRAPTRPHLARSNVRTASLANVTLVGASLFLFWKLILQFLKNKQIPPNDIFNFRKKIHHIY